MERTCEKCGTGMPHDVPRRRVAGLFVCSGCADVGHQKVAHDMSATDPLIIRHCAFCGSGQVIGRNDGSVECDFCQSVFTVRIEPFYPGWPQTVDGVTQGIPLHPNESPDNAGAYAGDDAGMPTTDNDGFGAGLDTEDEDDEWLEDEPVEDDDFSEEDQEDEEEENPFQRNSTLNTAFGGQIDEDAYIKHVALRLASEEDRDRVLSIVRDISMVQ